jgi:hypothetical protein
LDVNGSIKQKWAIFNDYQVSSTAKVTKMGQKGYINGWAYPISIDMFIIECRCHKYGILTHLDEYQVSSTAKMAKKWQLGEY